jgi:hypothetical protein
MTLVMSKAKWLVPLIVIVAMLAAVGLVWSQSGGSNGGDLSGLPQTTDQNPAYDDQVVAPSENPAPLVLYSLDMDQQTSAVALGSGTLVTLTLTNNIPEAIANGAYSYTASRSTGLLVPVTAMANGDITGDVVITADIYNNIDPNGCLVVYTNTTTGNGSNATGEASTPDQIVKIYRDITVHPGKTVQFAIPIAAGKTAVPGAEFMIKAAMYLPGTFGVDKPAGWPSVWPVPWMPGYLTYTGFALGDNVPTSTLPTDLTKITRVFGP